MLFYTGFKYCPKCASTMIHNDSDNSMKCDNCSFVYFHNSAAAVGCIINVGDRILFLRRNHEPMKGKLDLPGGFVEYYESFEDAVRREIREELNVNICDFRYVGSAGNTYKYKDVTYFTSDVFFESKVETVENLKPNEEIAELVLLRPDEVNLDDLAFISGKKVLAKYLKQQK